MQDRNFIYALLRLENDPRPGWAKCLGLHNFFLNDNEIESVYPRLKYKRKIGSHAVHPYAEDNYKQAEETRYDRYLKELLDQG